MICRVFVNSTLTSVTDQVVLGWILVFGFCKRKKYLKSIDDISEDASNMPARNLEKCCLRCKPKYPISNTRSVTRIKPSSLLR